MTSTTVGMTGDQNVNALLSGVRWAGTVFTYGFPKVAGDYGKYEYKQDHDNNPDTPAITIDESDGFMPFDPLQQAAAEDAFTEFRRLTNMSALNQEPAGGADVRLGLSSTMGPGNGSGAYADYPSDDGWGGDVWLNTTSYNNPRVGTRSYQTIYHEIGHAMGLKHGHEADNGNTNVMTGNRNSIEFSTMTYADYIGQPIAEGKTFLEGHGPQSFMMYDIVALQHMYGADFADGTHAGDTTYEFDPATGQMIRNQVRSGAAQDTAGNNVNVIFRTIWDGGGNDTYDFSDYGADRQLAIDLRPGGWTDVDSDSNFQTAQLRGSTAATPTAPAVAAQFAQGQVYNALLFNGDGRSLIENALGGAGGDLIRGNQANNYLFGDSGVDTLEGFDGNDTLDPWHDGGWMYGGGGQDTLWSGNGADRMDGGDGLDRAVFARSPTAITIDTTVGKVFGGDAQGDTLVNIENILASAHDDNIRTGGGDNAIWAGAGQDDIDGGAGGDRLFGEGGNDVLGGGTGRWVGDLYWIGDEIDGGDGVDTAAFNSTVTIDLRPGGVHGGEALGDAFISIERFRGSAERDFFYGNGLNNWFQGRGEGDYMNGGGGDDTFSYAERTSGITADMTFNNMEAGDETRHPNEIAGRTDGKVSPSDGTWVDTLISIESIEGTNYGDVFLGDERENTFWGLGGADRFEGDSGATPQGSWDDMFGGSGDDTFVVGPNDYADGGANDDAATFVGGALFLDFSSFDFRIGATPIHVQNIETYIGTDFGDTVLGAIHGETINLGAGADSLRGGGGNDFLYTGAGADVMDGGDGYDTIVFHKAMVADWQSGVLDADIASDPWTEWEAIQGSAGGDRIRTNSWGFSVELRGGAGDDVLATGVVGVASDILSGEDGNDRLDGGAGGDAVYGGAGVDSVLGGAGSDRLYGGSGADAVRGGADNDQIYGGSGSGADTLYGGSGVDAVRGGAGNDRLYGGSRADAVRAEDGADIVYGGSGADAVRGGDGADTLIGGSGADILIGGANSDVFRYLSRIETPNGAAADRIRGEDGVAAFQGAGAAFRDLIDLGSIDANEVARGDQTFVFGTARTISRLWAVESGSDTLIRGNVDDRTGHDFEIVIEDAAVLAAAYISDDFLL